MLVVKKRQEEKYEQVERSGNFYIQREINWSDCGSTLSSFSKKLGSKRHKKTRFLLFENIKKGISFFSSCSR
jgi:hypothetical protein